jgi:hypothetical protein
MSNPDDNTKRPGSDSLDGDMLVFPGEESSGLDTESQEGEFDGLETDDRQTAEIREIFGAAFPQYLQPIEELVEQLFSGQGDDETIEAIGVMISSLMDASIRMGFQEIHDWLNKLDIQIQILDEKQAESYGDDVKDGIRFCIEQLKTEAGKMGGEPQAETQKQRSIVEALKNKKGVGNLVLRRLSTAGLITVDQLLMARPDEIAAVSGIEIEVVHQLLDMLSDEADEADEAVPPEVDDGQKQLPSEVDSPHDKILEKVRAEGEAEATIEELKAEIRIQRSRINDHREGLKAINTSYNEQKEIHETSANDITELTSVLNEYHAQRQTLVKEYTSLEETIGEKEATLEAKRMERQRIQEQAAELSKEVGDLVDTVNQLRKSFARGRIVD